MIAHGVEMTDQGARFSVKVDLPEKDCIVVATFRVENGDHPENPYIDHNSTDGKWYDITSVNFPAGSSDDLFGSMDRKLEFRTTPMRFGDRTSVYVEGDHEIEESYLGAFPGDLDTTLDTMRGLQDFEWIRIWDNPSLFETKDGIQGYLYLPDFLPDGKVTLIVAFQDEGDGVVHWNYVTIGEGEIGNTSFQRNETTKVTSEDSDFVGLTWIAIAISLVIYIVRVKTDRRRWIG
jgi:hypothetical protein